MWERCKYTQQIGDKESRTKKHNALFQRPEAAPTLWFGQPVRCHTTLGSKPEKANGYNSVFSTSQTAPPDTVALRLLSHCSPPVAIHSYRNRQPEHRLLVRIRSPLGCVCSPPRGGCTCRSCWRWCKKPVQREYREENQYKKETTRQCRSTLSGPRRKSMGYEEVSCLEQGGKDTGSNHGNAVPEHGSVSSSGSL